MKLRIHALLLFLFLLVYFHLPASAQITIITQPLAQTSACPGTSIDVPFSVAGPLGSGNKFAVQLSKGTDLVTLPASAVLGNPATGQYTVSVTLANLPGSGLYKIKVIASVPATVGSESVTALFVKTQPASAPQVLAQSIGNYTSQYTFCQNDPPFSVSALVGPAPDNYRVLYDFGTALAGTSQRTFTAPVMNTSTVGRTTYNFRYVAIDETKGCSLAEQPGAVSYLTMEVKFRPVAPTLPAPALSYCQNQTASPLVATVTYPGSELLWYTASGTALPGSAPTPATTTPGSTVYQVTQSFDRCESAPASLTVTVQTASAAPTAPKTQIELCRGAAAEQLVANGTNLIWTDPTGTTSTVAPTPSTLNASKTPAGDVYYVAQGGATGCPSARLAIRVIVQAQTTLSLSGGKNVNLGAEVPLQLTFTGTGPYHYQITTNPAGTTLTGTATKDTALVLLPVRSATYQVTEVSNGCGAGLPGSPATATVTVLVPTIRTLTLQTPAACAGGTVTATFETSGTFNAGNIFRLQIARTNPDTAKISYSDLVIVQQVGNTQLTGTLPATATSGTYLVRVIATNPRFPIIGTPSATTLAVISNQLSATLSTSTPTIIDGGVAKLVVNFTGDGPWTFTYRDSTDVPAPQTVTTALNPYTLDLKPSRTSTYRLTNLSNSCATRTDIPGRVTVTVSPLLAVEPLAGLISVFPVPATSQITVQIDPSLLGQPATLLLVDEKGRVVLVQGTQQQYTQLRLTDQPTGLYVLQIAVDGQKISRRLVKH
ncbi:T9SS type A sorting domain-containing protein [uncultured Fibrella sp.]|uniref:T9SS type A sorting domain-containing protein n=1 Tax=uncultured Fibrella sp. TaxID=1284596 RepID=UPI0035CA3939